MTPGQPIDGGALSAEKACQEQPGTLIKENDLKSRRKSTRRQGTDRRTSSDGPETGGQNASGTPGRRDAYAALHKCYGYHDRINTGREA